jgi:hypothetical protein
VGVGAGAKASCSYIVTFKPERLGARVATLSVVIWPIFDDGTCGGMSTGCISTGKRVKIESGSGNTLAFNENIRPMRSLEPNFCFSIAFCRE